MPPRRLVLFAAIALAAVVLLPYLQTLCFDFVLYDDDDYVTTNTMVQQGLSWPGFCWAFAGTGHAANWHPLTWLSHMCDVSLFGSNPGAMHAVNLVLHAGSATVLFLLLLRLTGSWTAALIAASFWALHPLRVESVAWISQRKDVLSTFLGLSAMWCYLTALPPACASPRSPEPAGAKSAPATERSGLFLLATILFALAFMCKPTVVTFPILAALIEYAVCGRVRWRNLELPLWVGGCGMLVTVYVQGLGGAIVGHAPLLGRVFNAIASVGIYLQQTLVPANLMIPYLLQWPELWRVLVGVLTCLLLAGAFWYTGLSRRSRACGVTGHDPVNSAALFPYAAGVAWFVLALGPMIGLIQVGHQAHADRFTYWPSVGLAIVVAWGLRQVEQRWPSLRPKVWTAAFLIACTLFVLTCRQVTHWRNTETLFTWTLRVQDRNYLAHNNLGAHYLLTGRKAEGLAHVRLAAEYNPVPDQLSTLALVLIDAGRLTEAEQFATRARQIDPNDPLSCFALGKIAYEHKQYREAEVWLQQALVRKPMDAAIWGSLGDALGQQKRWPEAVRAWQRSLWLNPTLAEPRENLRRHAAKARDVDPNTPNRFSDPLPPL